MTVCVAALFRWNYAPLEQAESWGVAAITASDRMITAGDVEYEPQQLKVGFFSPRVLVLIAGDYSLHSQAIKNTHDQVRGNLGAKPHDIALIYGSAIQGMQRKEAEDRILAPLGLNTDSFLAQQKDMSDSFVSSITLQLQDYPGVEVEALIVGIENDAAHIYAIDRHGTVRCFDDVGFAAIGIGAWHARSRLMQAGYVNTWNLAPALAATFVAKKAAEIAPGIGKNTDIQIVLKDRIMPLWPNVANKLDQLYSEFDAQRATLARETVNKLQEYLNEPEKDQDTAPPTGNVSEGSGGTEGSGASQGAENPPNPPEQL